MLLYLSRLVIEVVGELDFSEAEVELERDGVVQVLVEVEGIHHACVGVALRCVFSRGRNYQTGEIGGRKNKPSGVRWCRMVILRCTRIQNTKYKILAEVRSRQG